jgi:hypothetical protein
VSSIPQEQVIQHSVSLIHGLTNYSKQCSQQLVFKHGNIFLENLSGSTGVLFSKSFCFEIIRHAETHKPTLVPEVYFYYFHCEGERENKPLVESGN